MTKHPIAYQLLAQELNSLRGFREGSWQHEQYLAVKAEMRSLIDMVAPDDDAVTAMFSLNVTSLTDEALDAARRHRLWAIQRLAYEEWNRRQHLIHPSDPGMAQWLAEGGTTD